MDNESPSVSSAVILLVFPPSAWRDGLRSALCGKVGVRCIAVDPSDPLPERRNPDLVVVSAEHVRRLPVDWRVPDKSPRIVAVCRNPVPSVVKRALDGGADLVLPRTDPGGLSRMLAGEMRIPLPSRRGVWIDREKEIAYADNVPLTLSRNEFRLLRVLVDHAPKGMTRRKILEEMHGPMGNVQPDSLNFTVNALRKKLGLYWSCVRTVWHSGYAWNLVPLDVSPGTGRRMIALATFAWVAGLVVLWALPRDGMHPSASLSGDGAAEEPKPVGRALETAVPAVDGDDETNAVSSSVSEPFSALRVPPSEDAVQSFSVREIVVEPESGF